VTNNKPSLSSSSSTNDHNNAASKSAAAAADHSSSKDTKSVSSSRASVDSASSASLKRVKTEESSSTAAEAPLPASSTPSSAHKSWESELLLPLAFASLECYETGTDVLLKDSFEVSSGGKTSGNIICSSKEELKDWVQSVADAIDEATMKEANKQLASSGGDDIIYQVGWVSERPIATQNTMAPWKPKFAGVRAENVYVFDSPPKSETEWLACERVYTVYESLCRAHAPPRQLLDERQNCFSVQHSSNPPLYFSVPTNGDAMRWENRIQQATHQAVFKIQSKSYACERGSESCEFHVDFNEGFQFFKLPKRELLWRYKFSQLKGSCDNGDTQVTFSFQNRATNNLDKQTFTSKDAYSLLFCVHAFLAAKLSLVDPSFIEKIAARSNSNSTTAAADAPQNTSE